MTVSACSDSSPAAWLLDQDREWYDLTARGPLGFERYARLRFIPDPDFVGQSENDACVPDLDDPGLTETQQLGVAVAHLARYSATPDECYYLIWDGWPDAGALCRRLDAARFDVNDGNQQSMRGYHLFVGDTDLSAWDNDAVGSALESELPIPAFIWPADRAWCVVHDVDPHFASIGASAAAIADILADSRIDVVDDDPLANPPRYV